MGSRIVIIGPVPDDLILEHLVFPVVPQSNCPIENFLFSCWETDCFGCGQLNAKFLEQSGLLIRAATQTLEELAVLCEIHPSKGQARKNGMFGPIPFGISIQGTKKNPVWVWRSPYDPAPEHYEWWRNFYRDLGVNNEV